MRVSVTQKAQIVQQHQRAAGDTGSPEVLKRKNNGKYHELIEQLGLRK